MHITKELPMHRYYHSEVGGPHVFALTLLSLITHMRRVSSQLYNLFPFPFVH